MALAANQNSSGRTHIVVISAPSQCDVAVARHEAIRGIEFHPARTRHEYADPSVRRIRAGEPFFSRRRRSHQVTAVVSRRKSQRAQTADLQMSEVLAHALVRMENFQDRRIDFRGARQESKVTVNALS